MESDSDSLSDISSPEFNFNGNEKNVTTEKTNNLENDSKSDKMIESTEKTSNETQISHTLISENSQKKENNENDNQNKEQNENKIDEKDTEKKEILSNNSEDKLNESSSSTNKNLKNHKSEESSETSEETDASSNSDVLTFSGIPSSIMAVFSGDQDDSNQIDNNLTSQSENTQDLNSSNDVNNIENKSRENDNYNGNIYNNKNNDNNNNDNNDNINKNSNININNNNIDNNIDENNNNNSTNQNENNIYDFNNSNNNNNNSNNYNNDNKNFTLNNFNENNNQNTVNTDAATNYQEDHSQNYNYNSSGTYNNRKHSNNDPTNNYFHNDNKRTRRSLSPSFNNKFPNNSKKWERDRDNKYNNTNYNNSRDKGRERGNYRYNNNNNNNNNTNPRYDNSNGYNNNSKYFNDYRNKSSYNSNPMSNRQRVVSPPPQLDGTSTKQTKVESAHVGAVIGWKGEILKKLEREMRVKVQFTIDPEDSDIRICTITGSEDAIEKAWKKIESIIDDNFPDRKKLSSDSSTDQSKKTTDVAYKEMLAMLPPEMASIIAPSISSSEEKNENKSEKLLIDEIAVPYLLGKDAQNIKKIDDEIGCHVYVHSNFCKSPDKKQRQITIVGTLAQSSKVQEKIDDVTNTVKSYNTANNNMINTLLFADNFYSNNDAACILPDIGDFTSANVGLIKYGNSQNDNMIIPLDAVGSIIGRGGEIIKSIQQSTGCKMNITNVPTVNINHEKERVILFQGPSKSIYLARAIVDDKVNALRENALSGQGPSYGHSKHNNHNSSYYRHGGSQSSYNNTTNNGLPNTFYQSNAFAGLDPNTLAALYAQFSAATNNNYSNLSSLAGGYSALQQSQSQTQGTSLPSSSTPGTNSDISSTTETTPATNPNDPYAIYGGYENYVKIWQAWQVQQLQQQPPK